MAAFPPSPPSPPVLLRTKQCMQSKAALQRTCALSELRATPDSNMNPTDPFLNTRRSSTGAALQPAVLGSRGASAATAAVPPLPAPTPYSSPPASRVAMAHTSPTAPQHRRAVASAEDAQTHRAAPPQGSAYRTRKRQRPPSAPAANRSGATTTSAAVTHARALRPPRTTSTSAASHARAAVVAGGPPRVAAERDARPSPRAAPRRANAGRTAVNDGDGDEHDGGENVLSNRVNAGLTGDAAGGSESSGGYTSDSDGRDGDAEEMALAAAANSIMPGAVAPGIGLGSSAAVTPHPWLVTDAFHVCLWYVLRYAGPALSAGDLWACRAVLSLTATPKAAAAATDGGEDSSVTDNDAPQEEEEEKAERRAADHPDEGHAEEDTLLPRARASTSLEHPAQAEQPTTAAADSWTWANTEESELLLRLILRKPHGFTVRHLEMRYGDWLHVQPTLDALSDERHVLWWASPTNASAANAVTELLDTPAEASETLSDGHAVEEGDTGGMADFPLLERYDGLRVAHLLLLQRGGVAGRMPAPVTNVRAASTPPRTPLEELTRVVQAVRATELRVFLSSLRHCSMARAARDDHHDNKGDGCPGSSAQDGATSPTPTTMPPALATPRAQTNVVVASSSAAPQHECHEPLDGNVRDLLSALATDGRRTGGLEEGGVRDAIPTRKLDMIRYFTERRYALLAPPTFAKSDPAARSSTTGAQNATKASAAAVVTARSCFPSVAEEMEAVAQCWDRAVGAVYAPHTGLRRHLVCITELFHVLTSNSGAGAVSEQGAKAVAATMAVAAPPTLLMVRPQLLLLLQTLHAARELHTRGTQPAGNGAASWSVLHALLPQLCMGTAATGSEAQLSQVAEEDPARAMGAKGEALEKASLMDELVCSSRFSSTPDAPVHAADHRVRDVAAVAPHLCLFATPAVLDEYRAALAAQRALYEAGDGAVSVAQRLRGRNPDFATRMHDTVMVAVRAGVAAVKQHPVHAAPSAARFVAAATSTPPPSASAVSLESLLYRHGCHAEHLLVFTPLYRWFACAELLLPFLQSARRYAQANECLHHLLYEPVFVLHPAAERRGGDVVVSPVTYAFRYKTHKRGEWLARLALNLSHLKRHADALALLEEVQAGYRQLASHVASSETPGASVAGAVHMPSPTWLPCDAMTNTTAAALWAVLAGECTPEVAAALPVKVHRRSRMLRVLFPPRTATTSTTAVLERPTAEVEAVQPVGSTCAVALQHAAWEYVRDRYCRRHDRLTLERALATEHRRVHQWTPLPAHRELTTRRLVDIPVRRVGGVRSTLDRLLWREPTGLARPKRSLHAQTAASGGVSRGAGEVGKATAATSATQVEAFVLRHYLDQWNTNTSTCVAPNTVPLWSGAHCEGQWIACLARAFLWDCYWAFPSTVTGVTDAASAAPTHAQVNETDASPMSLPCDDAVGSAQEVLWLSAFQDGPLDVTTPLHFVRRRRAVAEARLAELERCSREVLVRYVAARIRAEEPPAAPQSEDRANRYTRCGDAPSEGAGTDAEGESSVSHPLPPTRDDDNGSNAPVKEDSIGAVGDLHDPPQRCRPECAPLFPAHHADEDEELDAEDAELIALSLPSLCSPPPLTEWADSSSLPMAQDATDGGATGYARGEEGGTGGSPTPPSPRLPAALQRTIPEAWKVGTGSLPLLDILEAIPLAPLWRLLRCIYLSPLTEGVPLRFSGFPDLVLWRRGSGSETGVGGAGSARAPRDGFCLMEVKSPSDVLSTKQISVNDLLRRCGFDVSVVRVDEVHDDGSRVSSKRLF